jgi:hypothetical protein
MTPWTPRHKSWLILALSICVLGAAAGIAASGLAQRKSPVSLEPSYLVLVEDPLENQVVAIDFVLRNDSRRPVEITRAVGSCGCMDVAFWAASLAIGGPPTSMVGKQALPPWSYGALSQTFLPMANLSRRMLAVLP